MCKLSNQLRYFINKKISEDANWREVEVVLSGHEVPGEGEHKINDYIRLARAQPDYDPNIRHCLYGLDADLIMLGLLSHDPHFCLLREEVKFGPSARKKSHAKYTNSFSIYSPLLTSFEVQDRSIFICSIFPYCANILIWSSVIYLLFFHSLTTWSASSTTSYSSPCS
jgi:5'-3' exoribonuclease 1